MQRLKPQSKSQNWRWRPLWMDPLIMRLFVQNLSPFKHEALYRNWYFLCRDKQQITKGKLTLNLLIARHSIRF